ncbi:MAG TPA: RagB/SusD family nutrient uptake outer membrane protein, partial [Chitinophagaceae bacterium]
MNKKYLIIIISALFGATSCNKYLDAVPDRSLTIPTTLQDMSALLDNDIIAIYGNPALGEIGSDDYYLEYTTYQSRTPLIARNAYTWQTDVFQGNTVTDWDFPYRAVYYSNVVLDNLGSIQINTANQTTFNWVKGRALFYRAFAFYNLAQLFAKPYIPKTAATDLGIPLRLDADLNTKSVRSTVQQTYDQIIKDLMEAKDLLPLQVSTNRPNNPSKASAFAMLARVYLSIQDYENALTFADSTLLLDSALIDYNTVDITRMHSFPFP